MSDFRVLVVEDERLMVTIIQRVLMRKFDAVVDLAANGLAGLEQATAQPYKLILSDIKMPELDGISMLKRIRAATGPNQATPAIFLTGHHAEGQAAAAELGARFMAKPFRRQQLFDMVNELLAA